MNAVSYHHRKLSNDQAAIRFTTTSPKSAVLVSRVNPHSQGYPSKASRHSSQQPLAAANVARPPRGSTPTETPPDPSAAEQRSDRSAFENCGMPAQANIRV
ncbi:MAG: hypothetical protein IPP17_26830 [Bacteroidetes bacterium]|nr:hypothetical protein [Bacteroidota bacterium]